MKVLPCSAGFLCRRPLIPVKPDSPATMLRRLTSSANAAVAAASAFITLCSPGARQAVEGLALGRGGFFERAEKADMRGQRIVHHRHVRPRQLRQVVDFAG